MKRSDFRIIKIERFDGYDSTVVEYLIQQKKRFWFISFWSYFNLTKQEGYAENLINQEILRDEAYKKIKITKTIIG